MIHLLHPLSYRDLRRLKLVFALILGVLPTSTRLQNFVFPSNAGVIDVTRPPYSAKGDDRTDDTEALQQALLDNGNDHRIIYIPNGTYRISGSLRWPFGTNSESHFRATILQGQSRTGAVLRLQDYAVGFDNPGRPRPVLWTGEKGARRERNAIHHLTVDVGNSNPGAIGIQFFANQQGGVTDVDIRSASNSGVTGLDLGFSDENGPLFLKNLRVQGFEYGLKSAYALHGIVAEHLAFEGQREAAIRNSGQNLIIRHLISSNSCPAILNADGAGFVTLIDGELRGLTNSRPLAAIQNRGFLFARNVRTPGYPRAIDNLAGHNTGASGPDVKEFVSHRLWKLFPSQEYTLTMPIEETPDTPWEPLSMWTSPVAYGGKPDDGNDDSLALQRAIDSGATTIFLPNGLWVLREPVIVRGKIRHIIGCEARIRLEGMANREALVITNISHPVLTIERLHVEPTPGTFLSASTDKTLVLRHCANLSAQFQGNGKVFLEDVEFVGSVLWKGKDVWARQVTFDYDRDKIINDGGHFWALGLFASKAGTLVRTIHGGKTEILGGQIFSNGGWKTRPLFAIEDSSASFVFSEASYSNSAFETIVSETRGAKTKSLVVRGNEGMSERDLPFHAGGIALPLYTGSPVQ